MDKVYRFVNTFKPLLLLLWYFELDEPYLQQYFEGTSSWSNLLDKVTTQNYEADKAIKSCKSLDELDQICIKFGLYNFPNRRN